jgi:hypothetical protein
MYHKKYYLQIVDTEKYSIVTLSKLKLDKNINKKLEEIYKIDLPQKYATFSGSHSEVIGLVLKLSYNPKMLLKNKIKLIKGIKSAIDNDYATFYIDGSNKDLKLITSLLKN